VTGAGIVIARVPALGVRERQPVAKLGKLPVMARPDNEVPVVRQQAVRQESHAGHTLQGLAENASRTVFVSIAIMAPATTSLLLRRDGRQNRFQCNS